MKGKRLRERWINQPMERTLTGRKHFRRRGKYKPELSDFLAVEGEEE